MSCAAAGAPPSAIAPAIINLAPWGADQPYPFGDIAIAADDTGGWLASCYGPDRRRDAQPRGRVRRIFVTRSGNAGQTWCELQPIDRGTYADDTIADRSLTVHYCGDDSWAITWLGDGDKLVLHRRFERWIARSRDRGRTWSDAAPLFGAAAPIGAAAVPARSRAGTWVVPEFREVNCTDECERGDLAAYIARSGDDAHTWLSSQLVHERSGLRFFDGFRVFSDTARTDDAGAWIVAWIEQPSTLEPGSDGFLRIVRSADDGISWDAPLVVADWAERDAFAADPALLAVGAGRWVVAWTMRRGGADSAEPDFIYGAHSSDDGRTWSAPAPLSGAPDEQGGSDRSAKLVAGPDSAVLLVWQHTAPGETLTEYRFAISEDAGASWSTPARLSPLLDAATVSPDTLRFAFDRDCSLLAAWTNPQVYDEQAAKVLPFSWGDCARDQNLRDDTPCPEAESPAGPHEPPTVTPLSPCGESVCPAAAVSFALLPLIARRRAVARVVTSPPRQ